MENDYPKWYQSSEGPNLAKTLQSVVLSFMPVINLVLGSFGHGAIDNVTVNTLISSIIFVFFAGRTAYGYFRAKKVFGERIERMNKEIEKLGGQTI